MKGTPMRMQEEWSLPGSVANDGLETLIGMSKEKRPILGIIRGADRDSLKVMILAGQHGDERPARRTFESLLSLSPGEMARRLPNLQLAIIPEANPDGCAARTRCNADGVDLNRDHQLLSNCETLALHRFIREWQPRIILDLHSYPSRRLHLLARNIVLDQDVFLDVPTHPAIIARPTIRDGAEILRQLLRAIRRHDIRADRYTVFAASGRARHSTSDVVDARNGLALRYGILTILIENRQPRHEDDSTERQRLRSAQAQALWAVLEWLDMHRAEFPPPARSELPVPGRPVLVHFKYAENGDSLRMMCRDVRHGQPASVTFSRYLASVKARRTVFLPSAYAVPADCVTLRALLHRHGFASISGDRQRWNMIERLRIERARPSRQPDRPPRKVVVAPHRLSMQLDQHEIFPTRQTGGDALAVYLEPESKHGLHRYPFMQVPLVAHSWYPILRVCD